MQPRSQTRSNLPKAEDAVQTGAPGANGIADWSASSYVSDVVCDLDHVQSGARHEVDADPLEGLW